jgi:S1-C subfamily serine protease
MDRKYAPWAGLGCLVLVLLVVIPIGLAIWAFQGAGSILGELPPLGLPDNSERIPQTGPQNIPNRQPASTPMRPRSAVQPLGNLGQPTGQRAESLADLYDQVHTGAVSISIEVIQMGQSGQGAGSGFVLSDTGYIVTNHHVVEGASRLIVTFFNDISLPADVIGTDPDSDLAVIKVEALPENVIALPLGDSDAARVGEEVVAIGNPFGLGTSMSYGIVSALGRVIPSGFTQFNIPMAVQTDAAINPGNSGGPLINMNGEVIGVNAQIRTSAGAGGNQGIGFAIPSNILKLVYPALIEQGDYNWAYLGVTGATMSPAIAQEFNMDENLRGAFISQVVRGGPAEAAGIEDGDVVVQAGDLRINNFDQLLTFVAFRNPGDTITLIVNRRGQEQPLQVTLGERPRGTQTTQ